VACAVSVYRGRTRTTQTAGPLIPPQLATSGLTGVAAVGGAMVRAQAFACAHVQGAVLYDSPQLNAIR